MIEEFNVTLAARIAAARKSAGKTQQQIADALAVHVNQYQRLEAGKHRVSAFDLAQIAEAIGVTAGDLLQDSPKAQTRGPQCCMCGKKDLSTIEGDGGKECELSDGRWVCSWDCWERAVDPQV